VPTRYDLSYHDKVNKGIRSYNEKLREMTKQHTQVALIEIDIDKKYHTRHGLHFNKLGKLLFANKITRMIHQILSNKQKKGTDTNDKCRNQGDESEAAGRDQVNKDIRDSEDRLQANQSGVNKKDAEHSNQDEDENTDAEHSNQDKDENTDAEHSNQDEDEHTSKNSDDKTVKVRFNPTINQVIPAQELECNEVNKGVNKSVICEQPQDIPHNTQPKINETVTLEQTQDISNNNQLDCADKILETRRISTRNRKTPSTRGNDFLWYVRHTP
jgi:hypothetical protein